MLTLFYLQVTRCVTLGENGRLMGRDTRKALHPIFIAACCFTAGVVLTLLYTSFSSTSAAQQPLGTSASGHVSFANTSGAVLNNSTSSLSRHDLVIAIPSSIARYIQCIQLSLQPSGLSKVSCPSSVGLQNRNHCFNVVSEDAYNVVAFCKLRDVCDLS